MKKNTIILIVIFFLLSILVGCTSTTTTETQGRNENLFPVSKEGNMIRVKTRYSTLVTVYDLEYEGEHYLIVNNGNGVAITPITTSKEKN